MFVDIHSSSITRRNPERRTMVSDGLVDIAASIQLCGRLVLFDVVSHLGVTRVATRPYGYIHGPSDEPDDRRSASVATKLECDSFTTIQVQAQVYTAVGLFRRVRLFFLCSTWVT